MMYTAKKNMFERPRKDFKMMSGAKTKTEQKRLIGQTYEQVELQVLTEKTKSECLCAVLGREQDAALVSSYAQVLLQSTKGTARGLLRAHTSPKITETVQGLRQAARFR